MMYGPVKVWVVGFASNLDGLLLSAAVVEPAGIAEVPGSVSASAMVAPNDLVRWNTIVVSSGVLMPEIGLSVVAAGFAPAIGK